MIRGLQLELGNVKSQKRVLADELVRVSPFNSPGLQPDLWSHQSIMSELKDSLEAKNSENEQLVTRLQVSQLNVLRKGRS